MAPGVVVSSPVTKTGDESKTKTVVPDETVAVRPCSSGYLDEVTVAPGGCSLLSCGDDR